MLHRMNALTNELPNAQQWNALENAPGHACGVDYM